MLPVTNYVLSLQMYSSLHKETRLRKDGLMMRKNVLVTVLVIHIVRPLLCLFTTLHSRIIDKLTCVNVLKYASSGSRTIDYDYC